MTPDAFLRLARETIQTRQSEEVHHRSAARLAYYAAYHLIAQYFGLDTRGFEGRHETVRATLRQEGGPVASVFVRTAALRLPRLWDYRCQADYDLVAPFKASRANEAVADAERIFIACRQN